MGEEQSGLHFTNLRISGSSLEDGLKLKEMSYKGNSKLGAKNKEMGAVLNLKAISARR